MSLSIAARLACILGFAALASCASIPDINPGDTPRADGVAIRSGARPLSAREASAVLKNLAAQAPDATALERHLAIEQAVAHTPLYTGNDARILRDGNQTFGAIFAAIRGARRYVLLEYYILEEVSFDGQSLSDLLISKQKSGVEICIIYDSIGSLSTGGDFFSRLTDAGIKVAEFNSPNPVKGGNPFRINDRDHRKILVADGETAIIGGVNLSHTYQSAPGRSAPGDEAWHDTDLKLSGPVVTDLETLFRAQWTQLHAMPVLAAPPAVIPPQGAEVARVVGSEPDSRRPPFYVTVLSAIRNAENRIWITSAYFGPTRQQTRDLIAAARRGVDVRILVPSHSDSPPALAVQRSHYTTLLRQKVRVFEWNDGILHTKAAVVDGVWSITGSSNFDQRSVLYNDEVDAVVVGRKTAVQYEQLFTDGQARSAEISLAEWRRRSFAEKLRERFWRLWQTLL